MTENRRVRPRADRSSLRCADVLDGLRALPDSTFSLVVSSPPYNIGKPYERDVRRTLAEYREWQQAVLDLMEQKLTPDASICWQVGNYVNKGEFYPLDCLFVELFRNRGWRLRNRIVWRYNFGLNADKRFSGRYETLLWATRSDDYVFNLDPVRIPQLYPGKRHPVSKGPRAGQPSGNPKGKNPSDFWEFSAERDFLVNPVWDIPNVKAAHPEKTEHPCQFPVELAERCVLALSKVGALVLDPFVGTGATILAAELHGRSGVGIDRDEDYIKIAIERLSDLRAGTLRRRPLGTPVRRPVPTERVSKAPPEWVDDVADRA